MTSTIYCPWWFHHLLFIYLDFERAEVAFYVSFQSLTNDATRGLLRHAVHQKYIRHLHSLDIPTAKHLWSRQYWQRFLVILLMMQFLSRWQMYTMFFCTLRRKKPCRGTREETEDITNEWQWDQNNPPYI